METTLKNKLRRKALKNRISTNSLMLLLVSISLFGLLIPIFGLVNTGLATLVILSLSALFEAGSVIVRALASLFG